MAKVILPDDSGAKTSYNKFNAPNFEKQFDKNGNITTGKFTMIDERGCPTFSLYSNSSKIEQGTTFGYDEMGRIERFKNKGGKVFEFDTNSVIN